MGSLYIAIPEEQTNYVLNPSAEIAGNFGDIAGATTTRVTTESLYGLYSYRVVTAGAGDGSDFVLSALDNVIHTLTFRTTGDLPAGGLTCSVDGVITWIVPTLEGFDEQEFDLWTVEFPAAQCNGSVILRIVQVGAGVDTFYIDGIQMEQTEDYYTTYIDGTQEGCEWLGAEHASASQRDAQSRAGGRFYEMDADWNVEEGDLLGFGMPPIRHNIQSLPLVPGASFQSSKVLPRTLTIQMTTATATWTAFMTARANLIDGIKPDLVSPEQAFLMRYTGGAEDLEIRAHYDTGLGGSFGAACNHELKKILRFIAYDPFWHEVGESSVTLGTNATEACSYIIAKLSNETWDTMNNVGTGSVLAAAVAANGDVYLGGSFVDWGDANGDRIVKYIPQTDSYESLGTGCNGIVRNIIIDTDGLPILCGVFTTANGVLVNGLAKWNGATFVAYGTGVAGGGASVFDMVLRASGNLVIVGDFTTANGVANTDGIAEWTGVTFIPYGTGLLQDGWTVEVLPNDDVLVGGNFTTANAVLCNFLARWNDTTFVPYGTSCNLGISTMAVLQNGDFYISGAFTIAPDGMAVSRVAKYEGGAFVPLGSGLNAAANEMLETSDGLVYFGGGFTGAGGLILADRVAIWDGSLWRHVPFDLPGAASVNALAEASDGTLYFGFTTAGNVAWGVATSITNPGSSQVFPKIIISRTGGTSAIIQAIRNETTGLQLLVNKTLLDGETVTIDLTPGVKTVISSVLGNVLGSVLPGSDTGTLSLLSNINSMYAFVSEAGAPTITAYMLWRAPYWGVSGVL